MYKEIQFDSEFESCDLWNIGNGNFMLEVASVDEGTSSVQMTVEQGYALMDALRDVLDEAVRSDQY